MLPSLLLQIPGKLNDHWGRMKEKRIPKIIRTKWRTTANYEEHNSLCSRHGPKSIARKNDDDDDDDVDEVIPASLPA
jgi:hypothetical protein